MPAKVGIRLFVYAAITALALQAVPSTATSVSLDFEGSTGALLDGLNAYTYEGFVAGEGTYYLSAIAIGGPFNQTGSGFGINAPGAGDDTDAFDGAEAATFALATPELAGFMLLSVDMDRITTAALDEGLFEIFPFGQSVASYSTTFTNDTLDTGDTLNVNIVLNDGDTLKLSVIAGNGYGLEFLNFDFSSSYYSGGPAVPEPASALLLLLGLIGFICIRRR
jgi:hypothetical protein